MQKLLYKNKLHFCISTNNVKVYKNVKIISVNKHKAISQKVFKTGENFEILLKDTKDD